jgi:hypothetical protein
MIRKPGEREEQVRKAVEVHQELGRHVIGGC